MQAVMINNHKKIYELHSISIVSIPMQIGHVNRRNMVLTNFVLAKMKVAEQYNHSVLIFNNDICL